MSALTSLDIAEAYGSGSTSAWRLRQYAQNALAACLRAQRLDQADNLVTGVERIADQVIVFYREAGCEDGHQVTSLPADMVVSFRTGGAQ